MQGQIAQNQKQFKEIKSCSVVMETGTNVWIRVVWICPVCKWNGIQESESMRCEEIAIPVVFVLDSVPIHGFT
jgi:hypothetical protein